jgi:hypothetical protein
MLPIFKKFPTRAILVGANIGPLDSIALKDLVLTRAKCFPELSVTREVAIQVDAVLARIPEDAGTLSRQRTTSGGPDKGDEGEEDIDKYEDSIERQSEQERGSEGSSDNLVDDDSPSDEEDAFQWQNQVDNPNQHHQGKKFFKRQTVYRPARMPGYVLLPPPKGSTFCDLQKEAIRQLLAAKPEFKAVLDSDGN